jgi:hypothetical protein
MPREIIAKSLIGIAVAADIRPAAQSTALLTNANMSFRMLSWLRSVKANTQTHVANDAFFSGAWQMNAAPLPHDPKILRPNRPLGEVTPESHDLAENLSRWGARLPLSG